MMKVVPQFCKGKKPEDDQTEAGDTIDYKEVTVLTSG